MLVIRELFNYLSKNKPVQTEDDPRIGKIVTMVHELDQKIQGTTTDANGVPLWHLQKAQTETLKEMMTVLQTMVEALKDLRRGLTDRPCQLVQTPSTPT
jgi:hypothetical protein